MIRQLPLLISLTLLFTTNQLDAQAKKPKRPESPIKLEPEKTERAKAPVKPKIHTVLKQWCPFKFGTADSANCVSMEFAEYHPSGRMLKFVKYEDGNIESRQFFKYDNTSKKVEEAFFDNDSILVSRTTYVYDSKGNLIEESKLDPEGQLKQKIVCRYEGGKRVEEITYDSDGQVERKLTFTYDATGNRLESARFHSDGTLEAKEKFIYDEKRNKIEAVTYNSDGRVESKTTYKYDANNNLVEEATYEGDGTIMLRLEYRYDDEGNKTEFAQFKSEGKLDMWEKYKYAGKNRIEAAVYNADDEFMNKTAYGYDQYGTLEREIEYDKLNEPQRMIRYVIKHFP